MHRISPLSEPMKENLEDRSIEILALQHNLTTGEVTICTKNPWPAAAGTMCHSSISQ